MIRYMAKNSSLVHSSGTTLRYLAVFLTNRDEIDE